MPRKIFCTFLLMQMAVMIWAQPVIDVTRFNDRDGLDRNKVTGIITDRRGFIWVSTWGGLYRYDGYRFNSYRIKPGDGNELDNSRLDAIKEDADGNLWCRSYDRIYYFDTNVERYSDVTAEVERFVKKPCFVNKYYVLGNGYVWLIMNDHTCVRINLTNRNEMKRYYFGQDVKVKKVEDDSNGDSWILTNKETYIVGSSVKIFAHVDHFAKLGSSLIYLGQKTGRIIRYDVKRRSGRIIFDNSKAAVKSLFSDNKRWIVACTNEAVWAVKDSRMQKIAEINDVEQVYRSKTGDYWVNCKDMSVLYIKRNGQMEHLVSPFTTIDEKNHAKAMFEVDGVMVIMKLGHLMYYDTQTHSLAPFCTSDGQIYASSIGRDHADKNGLLWAGVENNIFERIRIYKRLYQEADATENIIAQYRDRRGMIWQSTDNSLVMMKDANGRLLGYLDRNGAIVKNKVPFARVYAFAEDKDGNFFLGSRGSGLFCLKRDAGKRTMVCYMKSNRGRYEFNDSSVYSLLPDHRGRLWVGTYEGGLNLMVKTKAGGFIFRNKNNGLKNFPPCNHTNCIRSMAETKDHVIVIATSNGVYTFDNEISRPEGLHFYHSMRISSDAGSLPGNEVLGVYDVAGFGTFVATSFSGLCVVESKNLLSDNLRFKTWGTLQDAPSDEPRGIFVDRFHRLWVVFKNVVSHLDRRRMTSVDFSFGRGNNDAYFTMSSPIMMANGSVILATENGSFIFNPQTIKSNRTKAPLAVTDVRVFDRSIPYSLNSDTITLKSNQRDFVLEFAALELGGTDNVEYAYMLEGRDSQWIKNGRNRTLHFFNIGAGTYTLLIRSTNNDRIWTNNVRRLTIIVEPTFWETGWAMTLYVLLALMIAVAVAWAFFYVYRLRMNVSFEKKMVNMKLKYFTDISHDLRTPLTLIDGPVTELLEEEQLSDKAHSYLSVVHRNAQRMLTLINQILDFRKIQNEKMKLLVEKIDVCGELRSVMSNFDYISKENKIDFRLEVVGDTPAYVWADRDKMDKVFFNLLSNAFKYTKNGHQIWIEVSQNKEQVSVSVCDTGIGMPMNMSERLFERFETMLSDNYHMASSGIGLSLVKELVDMHHAQLKVDSKEGQGSRFTVVFRHGCEHFMQDEKTEFLTEDNAVMKLEREGTVEITEEGERMSVLIVEDNGEMLSFLRDILKADFHIFTAANGKEGLEMARVQLPDLIISDICMPVMDGWLMVRMLRGDVTTSHIPVVLLTAKSSIDDRIEGAKLGVEDYIVKPFNPTYLKTRVHTILQKQRERQEIYSKQFFDGQTMHLIPLPEDNSGVQLRMEKNDADMMVKLKAFMEENLERETVINDMADYVGLSRTVFYNKMKTITGLSPIDFSRKYRVERAAQMMRDEGLSVSEACYNTGFSDPKYFSKIFKKFFGVAPNDYRKGRS